jgi:hemolysin D
MYAENKEQTFLFTKYGFIEGEVTSVSNDATVNELRGLTYSMQIKTNTNTSRVNGADVRLKPGMAVTAEVQTGHRRIIEFFMAPFLKYKNESIRER